MASLRRFWSKFLIIIKKAHLSDTVQSSDINSSTLCSRLESEQRGIFYNQLMKYQVIYVLGRVEDIIYAHQMYKKGDIATIRNNFLFYRHFKSTRPILKIFKSVRKITKICRDPNLIR